jgi:beta-lactamase superfamily II metal-dependent hydrolase
MSGESDPEGIMASMFTIEALDAGEGDCLLVLVGDPASPTITLIDGGPARTYNRSLRPRLRELQAARGAGEQAPLPLDLVVLTHVDDDHVAGLLKLVEALAEAKEARQPAPVQIGELWHNSFDDLIGEDQVAAAIAYLDALPEEEGGALAGTRQGRELRDLARKLKIAVNEPFGGRLVGRPDDAAVVVEREGGLRLTVLGPTRSELRAYQTQWDRDLKAGRAGAVAATPDTSTFNLSSVMLLAEVDGRRALLTGDGRADHLLAGLVAAGLLSAEGDDTLHVDVFKLPHHGSCRNVSAALLRRVTAATYIISANGKHDNPDIETLELLAEARGEEEYSLVLTFPERAYERVDADREGKRRAALEAVDQWLAARPEGRPRLIYREPDALSVVIELGAATNG